MRRRRSLEEEINVFLEEWDSEQMVSFLRETIALFELFDIEDEDDWVKEVVGEENSREVRMIRAVYLISRIAEFHSAKLCKLNIHFKGLWRKMEKVRSDLELAS